MSGPPPAAVRRAAERLAAALGEPAWLAARRLDAARAYADAPEPTDASDPAAARQLAGLAALGVDWLQQAAWRRARATDALAESDAHLRAQGLEVRAFGEVARERGAWLEACLARLPGTGEPTRLACLLEALATGGSVIVAPAGLRLASAPLTPPAEALARHGPFARTLIVVGAGAEVGLLLGCARARIATDPLRAHTVEALLEPGAALSLASVEAFAGSTGAHLALRASVGDGARLAWRAAALAGGPTGIEARVTAGRGARLDLEALAAAAPGERVVIATHIDADAGSIGAIGLAALLAVGARLLVRGALGAARGARLARSIDALGLAGEPDVRVSGEAARGTRGVGRDAHGPPDRVRLRHVDDEAGFYLRARGLETGAARGVLASGLGAAFAGALPAPLASEVLHALGEAARRFPDG